MAMLNGFDYYEVQFTKDGAIFDRSQLDQLLGNVNNYSDVFVIAHGWNNDEADARALYNNLTRQLAAAMPRFPLPGRTFAVLGALWPSKKFADAELIPGGGASATQQDAVLASKVERLKEAIAAKPEKSDPDPNAETAAAKLDDALPHIPNLDTSAQARAAFVAAVRAAFAGAAPSDTKDDASDRLFTASADDLLARLGNDDDDFWDETPPRGGAASFGANSFRPWTRSGGAAGLGSSITSFKNGARNLLNLFTYFTMKERAGVVGKSGAARVLDELLAKKPSLKIHLIGHSFGGRLVTAAADAVHKSGADPGPIETLALLQAAYSHNGLSANFDGHGAKGFFNGVMANKKVRGPIIISHTRNDRAVGIAYPLASRLNGDVASGLGDANDPHGGMGSNGAQKSDAKTNVALTAGAQTFPFNRGNIYNLLADTVISGHSDITKPEVASAIFSAVSAT